MKRLVLAVLTVLVMTGMFSCRKKQPAPTEEQLLTMAPWLGDHADIRSEMAGSATEDLSSDRLEMDENHRYRYFRDNRQIDQGRWEYARQTDSLFFYPDDDDPVRTKVTTLTRSQLTLQYTQIDTLWGAIEYTLYYVRNSSD